MNGWGKRASDYKNIVSISTKEENGKRNSFCSASFLLLGIPFTTSICFHRCHISEIYVRNISRRMFCFRDLFTHFPPFFAAAVMSMNQSWEHFSRKIKHDSGNRRVATMGEGLARQFSNKLRSDKHSRFRFEHMNADA